MVTKAYSKPSHEDETEDERTFRESQNKKVKEKFEGYSKLANTLLPLCKNLKRQEKLEDSVIEEIEQDAYKAVMLWYQLFPNQDGFPKQHALLAHLLPFIKREKMCGRISEEGFEAFHPTLNKLKEATKRVAGSQQQAEVQFNRLAARTKSEVEAARAGFEDSKSSKTKNRPKKYNTNRKTKQSDNASIFIEQMLIADESRPGNFYYNEWSPYIIKEEWAPLYLYLFRSQAPPKWKEHIPTSNIRQNEAGFI